MKIRLTTIFFSLLLGFCQAQTYDPGIFQTLEDSLVRIMEANNIPGLQVVLTNRDSNFCQLNLGLADTSNNTPVTGETMFRIGSISKSFVAVSIMMLAEDGLVKPGDPVSGIIPEIEFENKWEATDPVRIGNLLEHTAGFDDIHIIEYATQADGWTTKQCLDFHPDSRTFWRHHPLFLRIFHLHDPVRCVHHTFATPKFHFPGPDHESCSANSCYACFDSVCGGLSVSPSGRHNRIEDVGILE